jgi:hypothetical protein
MRGTSEFWPDKSWTVGEFRQAFRVARQIAQAHAEWHRAYRIAAGLERSRRAKKAPRRMIR